MTVLTFNATEVARVARHALTAPKSRATWGEKDPTPALWLVGDSGIYLMSNGDPMDDVSEPGKHGGPQAFIAYAEGTDPQKDRDWYENKRAWFGGDDGVEALPWCEAVLGQIDAGATEIRISLVGNSIELLPVCVRAA